MRCRLSVILPLLALLAACDDPRVEEYEPLTGIITGTILFQQPSGPPPCGDDFRGNVIMTLFRADALPPPDGTSGPVNFIVVPESKLFDHKPDNGVFATPYTIPQVPAGRYQLRAFVDADGDFHPTIDLLNQATAGDIGGGHVDTVTSEFLEIEVRNGEVTGQVTVSIGRVFPVERPVFRHLSSTNITVPFTRPVPLVLGSHSIRRPNINADIACNQFLIQYADLDRDGRPDDANGDHLPDLFPQVILRLEQTETETRNVVIPGLIDPLPYQDALSQFPAIPTSTLTVLLPPVALEINADGSRTFLPGIPVGRYTTIVISGTGQTWSVPNGLDVLIPDEKPDPTQSVFVETTAGPALPAGGISGIVRVDTEAQGDVYVVAFDAANPPPPAGTGSPLGLVTIPAAAFDSQAAMREASFVLRGLPDGQILLVALLDVDRSFSPVVDLLAQASAGDFSGRASQAITVQGGVTEGARVVIDTAVPFDRPAFSFDAGISLSRAAFPATVTLTAHAVPAIGIDADSARVPVVLTPGADLEGDNFEDVLPRVLLTRMVDEGDPRTAANDPRGIVIPALVESLPFYAPLIAGVPAVPASEYRIILPPVAVELAAGGAPIVPPPAGRYRINVLSVTSQTWSVPNDLDFVLGRAGGPLADPTQARYITVEDTPLPTGSIAGDVQLTFAPPADDDFSVVVFAFAAANPPPPLGAGRPVAVSVLRKSAFGGGMTAPYRLAPLATGMYTVRAFLDADDDFTPWFDMLNAPDGGDVGGGYIDGGGNFQTVTVDAQAGGTTGVPVILDRLGTIPWDRPAFSVGAASPVLVPSTGSVAVTLSALSVLSDVASVQGTFPIRWADLSGNGVADDVNQDGNPDVFPIIVADLLDESDPTNRTVSSRGIRIPGLVDPRQFSGLGFPATDPTNVAAIVIADQVRVVFPAIASSRESPGMPVVPPPGKYRITVVNPIGQVWWIPNELEAATGTPFVESQGQYLMVQP